jgi:lipopolysaccharide transport system ATP-binding protein
MSEITVRVENLKKRYRINAPELRSRTLGRTLADFVISPFDYLRTTLRSPSEAETIWALKGVSFEVHRGEVLGILGHNGAGKSTLLSILSRITLPTAGLAQIKGRVGSLLQVGTGFHPELTGRENIYLNGTILGMKGVEVDRKFDQIVDFSGVEPFIDTPIKRYSSGMIVRLGFSVAIFLDPEVLLIDEVLSVGDAEFRQKSLEKINQIISEGRTVLFVSHDINTVQRLCKRSILLENGNLIEDAETNEIIDHYLPVITDILAADTWMDLSAHTRQGFGETLFSRIRYRSDNPTIQHQAYPDGPLEFFLEVRSDKPQVVTGMTVNLFDPSGFRLINAGFFSVEDSIAIQKGENLFRLSIDSLHLKPGNYQLTLWMVTSPEVMQDYVPAVSHLVVVPGDGGDYDRHNMYRDKVTSQVEVSMLDQLP